MPRRRATTRTQSHLRPAGPLSGPSAAPAIVQLPIHCSGGGETMAELVAAMPSLLAADQADQHYADAVQTAVAACAEDTEGQTCFICMDGAAEEGLVRGCACRGAAGVAHVSCLARQAQVLVADAEENSSATLDDVQEAVVTLWDAERIARRVFGDAHPLATAIEGDLRNARAALHAHESPPTDAREDGDLDEVEDA